jgi:hypothetical protein
MANASTLVDALRTSGLASETSITLNNPGGNNPWLFTWPAGLTANAGAPVALSVPVVQGEGPQAAELLSGGAQSTDQIWYADRAVFRVRAVGRVLPNAFSKTLKLYLFAGNGITAGTGLVPDLQLGFASATLPASSSAYSNWWIYADCLWDSSSLQLNGTFEGQIAGTVIAKTGFSVNNPSAWAAQQAPGSYNPLSFVVGVNLASSANANPDQVTLDEFTADEV